MEINSTMNGTNALPGIHKSHLIIAELPESMTYLLYMPGQLDSWLKLYYRHNLILKYELISYLIYMTNLIICERDNFWVGDKNYRGRTGREKNSCVWIFINIKLQSYKFSLIRTRGYKSMYIRLHLFPEIYTTASAHICHTVFILLSVHTLIRATARNIQLENIVFPKYRICPNRSTVHECKGLGVRLKSQ